MAQNSVTKRASRYHLPEAVRLALVSEADNPGGVIPPHRLAVVQQQRRRFIAVHGHDGFGCSIP